jgi:hypothetical protein
MATGSDEVEQVPIAARVCADPELGDDGTGVGPTTAAE